MKYRKAKEVDTFYDWCIKNKRYDFLDSWDYALNEFSPKGIKINSAKRVYFICKNNPLHKPTSRRMSSLTSWNTQSIECIECNSFYKWCEKFDKLDYISRWNYDLNKLNPNELEARSTKYMYFNCDNNCNHKPLCRKIANITKHDENSTLKCIECNSFEKWCIDNNRLDLIERWDYALNKVSPKEIFAATNKRYYFMCDKGLHASIPIRIINITNGATNRVLCPQCNSFETWCKEHSRLDLLNRWDYELNKESPNSVSFGSSRKYFYFKCPENKHSSKHHTICEITKNNEVRLICDECNSFAKWGIDTFGEEFLDKYWDYNKNKINPWEIFKSTSKKVYMFCQIKEYHGSYKISCSDFYMGGRCSYCNGNQSVHRFDSLGYNYPDVINIWSNLNKLTPFDYKPFSNKKVYWKCEHNKHDDYLREIGVSVPLEFRCPKCSKERTTSILQEKVSAYINTTYSYPVSHEFECSLMPKNPKTGFSMPFDNDIKIDNYHLIIEVHGSQHYRIDHFAQLIAKKSQLTKEQVFHQRKLYDRYKKYIAYINGYHYLEVPYWTEKDESYKTLIDNKISEILENNKFAS